MIKAQSSNRSKWEYSNPLYRKHLDIYLDRVYHHLKASGAQNVLDAGCGEGYVYRAMRARGYQGKWTAFDFSAQAVRDADSSSRDAQWLQASATAIPFANRSFDLVFSSEVLEHLDNPMAALKEFERVSSNSLLITVPWEPLFRTLTWFSTRLKIGGDPGHVNFWSGSSFRKFLQSAGALQCWERTTIYQIARVKVVVSNNHAGDLQQLSRCSSTTKNNMTRK